MGHDCDHDWRWFIAPSVRCAKCGAAADKPPRVTVGGQLMGVRHLGDLTWLSDLDPVGQDHVLKHLVADEVCACGHLDEEHDADSACMANNTDGFGNMLDPGSFAEPHYCHAYNPIQQ